MEHPEVTVVITPPRQGKALAGATITLRYADSSTLEVSDWRILRNERTNVLWVSPPQRALKQGNSYSYELITKFDVDSFRRISSAILSAFSQSPFAQQNGGSRG